MVFINKITLTSAGIQQRMRVNNDHNERPPSMFILMLLAILFAISAYVCDITYGANYELIIFGYIMCNFELVMICLI